MNKTYFAQCPSHGDAPALTRTETRYTRGYVGVAGSARSFTVEVPCTDGRLAGCPTCKQWVPARIVNALSRHDAERYGNKCDGRCTSGKRTCECKCGGLCHGRGECVCGKVA